jgi:hypothetical protein
VRTLEARARASNREAAESRGSREGEREGERERGHGRGGRHPDLEDAVERISEALAAALGAEVAVRPQRSGGFRAELTFASLEEALELAGRLRRRRAA